MTNFAESGARVIPFPVPPGLERARGTVRIAFVRRGAGTAIADLYQAGCAKVRLPHPHGRREAVLINSAGGLTDGDWLRSGVSWGRGSSALVTSQAAERIYRSREAPARVETRMSVGPSATALWLPQETILFDGANLLRKTTVAIDPSARLVACEALVFGRAAMGEAVRRGAVVDDWRVRSGGRLIFADGFRLSGDMAGKLDRPAVGGGARALATVLYVGPDAAKQLAGLRAVSAKEGDACLASSCLGPITVTRILAQSGKAMRHALSQVLTALMRDLDGGLGAAGLPRVWSC